MNAAARLRRCISSAILCAASATVVARPLRAQDTGGSSWWSSIVNSLGGMAGAGCSDVLSFDVQLLGHTFCQRTVGSTDTYGQSRLMRIEEATALGLTFSMFTSKQVREQLFAQHQKRITALAKTLDDRVHEVVRVPSEVLRQFYVRPADAQRTYKLSIATVVAFSGDLGLANQRSIAPDPAESALAARSLALANALDQNGNDVIQQSAPRATALASGSANGAESGRQLVEGQAMLSYVLQTQGVARSQHVELPAYRALKAERSSLFQSVLQNTDLGIKP